MTTVFFRCRLQATQHEAPPQYVFSVSIESPERPGEAVAQWQAPPTPIDAFYTGDNGVVSEPDSRNKQIITKVQYAGRVVGLYALRFSHGTLVPVGHWAGADVKVRTMDRMLTVVVTPPDWTELPQLWVWSGGKYTPAGGRFNALYGHLGDDYLASINNPQPTTPVWLYFDCIRALKAYSAAGELERGKKACRAAQTRLSNKKSLTPYFPSDSLQQFESQIKDARGRIAAALSGTPKSK